MATQDEARQAIIDAIVELAPQMRGKTEPGEQVKALAEAWQIVRRSESSRQSRPAIG